MSATVGGSLADDVDPDAPWRPGRSVEIPYEPVEPALRATTRAEIGAPSTPGPPDPWSRAAAESGHDWLGEMRRERSRGRQELAVPAAGPEAVTARVPGAPASSVTGEVVLFGVVVSAFLLVAALVTAVLLVGPAEQAERSARGLELPPRADERWSVVVPGRVDQVEITERALLVRTQTELSALDPETGSTMWTRVLDDGAGRRALHVVGSTAILVEPRSGDSTLTTGIDVGSGAEWWSREGGDSFTVIDRWLVSSSSNGASVRIQLRDPLTGDALADHPPYVMGPVAAPPPLLAEQSADRLTLYDLDTGRPVSASIDAFGISTLAMVGDVLVGFDSESTIAAFDSAGTRTDQRPFVSDAFGDFSGRAELVGGVPDSDVGIVASGTSLGFRVEDGRIDVAWQVAGRVGAPVMTTIGPVSVARVVDPSSGEVDMQLIDPVDGTVIVTTDEGETREEEPIVGTNGYLLSPLFGAAVREVAAFGFDGSPWWSVVVPQFGSYVVGEHLLVVLERLGNDNTVTVYG